MNTKIGYVMVAAVAGVLVMTGTGCASESEGLVTSDVAQAKKPDVNDERQEEAYGAGAVSPWQDPVVTPPWQCGVYCYRGRVDPATCECVPWDEPTPWWGASANGNEKGGTVQ